jgi:tetratricopeptide (TPR) repeat protein
MLAGANSAALGCVESKPSTSTTTAGALARADSLLAAGKTLEALAAYRALAKDPASAKEAARGLGTAYASLRRWEEADGVLAPYVKAHPEDVQTRLVRVSVLLARGDRANASTEVAALAAAHPKHLRVQLYSAALASEAAERAAVLKRLAHVEVPVAPGGLPNARVIPPYDLLAVRAELLRAQGDDNAAMVAEREAQRAPVPDPAATTALAEAYQRTGQLVMADRLLQRVVSLESVAIATLRAAAEIALELDKPTRALTLLEQIPTDKSVGVVDGVLRARARLALGETAQATADLHAWVAVAEKDGLDGIAARARLWLARALAKQRQFDAAKQVLKPSSDPQLEQERVMAFAEIELAAGQTESAIAALVALLAKSPSAVAPQILLGSAYLKAGAHADAERVLRALTTARPGDPRVAYLLGSVRQAQGDKAGARAEYERALELAPGSLTPLVGLVSLLDEVGDPSAGDAMIRSQIAAAPRIGAVQRLLGTRLEARGDLKTAELAFKAGVDADGGNDSARIELADFYSRTARPTRAIEILENVLTRTPNDTRALVRVASALMRVGQRDAAVSRYERALSLVPHDVGVQNNLALVLITDPTQHDRALSLAQSAHAAAPDVALVTDTLGYVHLVRGEIQLALPLLKQSAQALPQHGEVLHHLGLALLKAGDQAGGRKALASARRLDPSLPPEDESLRRLAASAAHPDPSADRGPAADPPQPQ